MDDYNQNYWANSSTQELPNHLKTKINDYIQYLENSGIMPELRKSYRLFYGNSAIIEHDSGAATMQVNHYGSLVRSVHTMVTQNRPAFECRAVNSDFDSQAVTQLGQGLVDYYLREKGLESHLKSATELALFLREGWIVADWAPQSGEIYGVDPDSQQPIYQGDVEYNTFGILDVIRDVKNKSKDHSWFIVRKQKNKFDLAAQFPELQTEILNTKNESDDQKWNLSYVNTLKSNTDQVDVYTFYHSKTPSMPQGRLAIMVGETILVDGPLPYNKPYVFPIRAQDAYQTAFGHSNLHDCIPLQDALDSCFSIALSNLNSFGLGSIVSEKGSMSVSELRTGLLHLEHNKGTNPPQKLDLLQIPAEIFNFATMLIQNQETISGVNSVARGNVPHQMSGTAMALVANQALTFSSGVQHSLNTLLEHVGSSLIELLQTFATVPRVAQIVGKTKKSYMKQFKCDDLKGISRVVVESTNALTKTTAGKVEIANNLLQSKLITTPEQYIQVVTTGTLEPLTEFDNAQNMLIRLENEQLTEGKPQQVVAIDLHELHVREHSVVLANPDVRNNPQVLQVTLDHIQQHINQAKSTDPALMFMLKQQPLPQAPPQAPQQNPALQTPQPQTMAEAKTPDMPTIAGTQTKFNPQGPQG